MMDLQLTFVDAAGVPASGFLLTEENGQYALPRLMLTVSDGEAWPEDVAITSCEVSPPEPALRQALLAEWRNTGPLGHGRLIYTEQRWLPAHHLHAPAEVSARWAVMYYDRGPYERFTNNVPPLWKEASVTLRFAPPVPEQKPGGEGSVSRVSSPAHRGHVAVDFGTSNCTASLFDQRKLPVGQALSHEQVSNLRTSILKLLDHGPWPGVSAEEFPELIADVATAVLRNTGGGDDALRARLRSEVADDSVREPRVLYNLLVELERRLGQCSEELRPQLAAALNEAYSQAWRVAPLDRLRLFEVQLDVIEGKVIESKATATTSPALRVTVGAPRIGLDGDDEHAAEPLIYAGLKQKLGSPEKHEELGAGATSDDLIREALRDIIGRCNDFIEKGAEGIGRGRVNRVVITFPTMASPSVRQKLRTMVNDVGVSFVDNSYDEAIAAAMFTLMRDFGGDHDTGLELLRSQSRETGEGRWKQNLLVIDIGGGTTDIALLALHLRNMTPANLGDPGKLGRYYELLPELLGSTGRLQLGGELTSLRVFYWIKALLGDQLLRAQPHSFGPAVGALRQLKLTDDQPADNLFSRGTWRELPKIDEGSGTDIFDVLDEIVPTRSAPPYGRPSQAFWLLWTLADRVKRDFCAVDAPSAITLGPRDLGRVLQAAEWPAAAGGAPDVASLPEEALTVSLTRERFDELVSPDLREIMDLAYRLAGERLAGPGLAGEDEQVDRIILTGQASRAPLVREQLLATFSAQRDKSAVRWQPSAVVVESDYAKVATSLGACWAKSNQGLASSPEGAEKRLREGRNEFRIIVDNLFFNLPCTFVKATILGGQRTGDPILSIGAELYQIYPDQDLAVIRSPEFELTNIVAIYRDGQGDLFEWGDFQWEEADPERKKSIWPHEIRARLEVTSNLDLFLLLSRGPARYQVDGEAIQVRDALPDDGASGSPPAFAPDRIVVNAYSTDGDHAGTEIFSRDTPDPDQDQDRDRPADSEAFPEIFHSPAEPAGAPGARGAISSPLPPPPVGGAWTFHYLDDQGDLQEIGALSPPPRESQLNIRYYASVDEHGNLRLHDGAVPYWPAASLEDVEARPGAVYRTPMYPTDKDYNPARDPYNGRH
jgi:hypothetical protein